MIEAQSRFRSTMSERGKNQGPDACRSWIETEDVKLVRFLREERSIEDRE